MEAETSLPQSQQPVTCPCPEPDQSCTEGADKYLALRGRKQATATEYFEFDTSYL